MHGIKLSGALIALLLVAGCSKAPESSDETGPQAAEERAASPDIGITRVPGVSMTYQYGFRLPAERVASVQEEHAARCEAMTPVRCRITGMTYDVGRRGSITGSLAFRLAPDLARRFGKDGVHLVETRGGMLGHASIDSAESGAAIAAADRDSSAIAEERQRLETQLARSGLPAAERTQLQARLADLSGQARATAAVRADAAAKLASTPVTFTYESGAVDPGLHDGPILGAIKDGWANIIAGVAVILTILITLIPWVATAALGFGLWRLARRWWRKWRPVAD